MGALFHRERTGEATIVDVSLLGTGLWAMGQAIALVAADGRPDDGAARRSARGQPARRQLPHQRRTLLGVHLPAGRQVLAAHLRGHRTARARNRPPLRRPRVAHGQQRRGRRRAARRVRPADPRRVARAARRLHRPVDRRPGHARGGGRSTIASPTATCRTARPPPASRSSSSPRRFSSTRSPTTPGRAPEFNEHGDAILADLGLDWDTIVDLKVRGVVA